ncbi:MAG: energy-dependent translational throttle protein EttA [Candidatus Puniceispirillum sp.]|nr:energy-dependent translational throttle protein EttA [Candidatus Pelagibacter sp.]MBA4283646.1 energy-dependent translational throttle protein EttA [Candidatus Puniceispirillum sp.]
MASYQYVYVIKELRKAYPGGKEVIKDLWLSFLPGVKIGVIGPNGAGKSTILKIMAGLDKEFQGEAWAAEGATIGYLPQEPQLDPSLNVIDNIKKDLGRVTQLLQEFDAINLKFSEPMSDEEMNALLEQQTHVQDQIDALNAWDLDRQIEIAMDALRCPSADSSVEFLSGGEKRRIALCSLLMQKPDLLLLDEPTNHLDAESVAWLERHLQEYKGTVVLITHDRYFLDNVVSWILEVDRGQGFPFEGNYSDWLENKQKRLMQEQKTESSKQKQLERELEWIRQSPKGRQSKSKARINAYEDLLNQTYDAGTGDGSIVIPAGDRLGDTVINFTNVSKGFEDRLLIDDLNFKLPRGGIVGVIGPNGAGKTTLFKLMTERETADSGKIEVGESVNLGYVDQSRHALNDNKTLWEEISDGLDVVQLGKKSVPSRAYCSWFNFKGSDQQKKIGMLSGGERNRVHLAKILKSGANVLLLDEPTNDLDVETLRSLEEALLNFAGCAVVISHDRFFLDRIATHILAFEGDSHVEWFEGNYGAYEEDRKRRFGIDALQPTRIKYKPLSK